MVYFHLHSCQWLQYLTSSLLLENPDQTCQGKGSNYEYLFSVQHPTAPDYVGNWSMVRPPEHSSNISDKNCTTALTQLWNIWCSAAKESYSIKFNGLNNSQCFVIWRFAYEETDSGKQQLNSWQPCVRPRKKSQGYSTLIQVPAWPLASQEKFSGWT